MKRTALRQASIIAVMFFCIASAVIGVVLLIGSVMAWSGREPGDGLPERSFLLAMAFLGLPCTIILFRKARVHARLLKSEYDLPDSPVKHVVLTMGTVVSLLLTITFAAIYFVLYGPGAPH
jgi:hypothetical protein